MADAPETKDSSGGGWWNDLINTVSDVGVSATEGYKNWNAGRLANAQADALKNASTRNSQNWPKALAFGGAAVLLVVVIIALAARRSSR